MAGVSKEKEYGYKWKVVDSKNNVIDYYRTKNGASIFAYHYEREFKEEVEIKPLSKKEVKRLNKDIIENAEED